MQKFVRSPLPFQGQKRMFLKEFKEVLRYFPPTATYVDLFGGSGLLSYTIKQYYPKARVIYNDYDNYTERLKNIDKTNALLADIKAILGNKKKNEKIEESKRKKIIKRIAAEKGFVDYATLSANLLFSGNRGDNLDDFKKHQMYCQFLMYSQAPTHVKQYDTDIKSYLKGLEIVRSDAHALLDEYKRNKNVVFILDPPYLNTNQKSYKDNGWGLINHLNLLHNLQFSSRYIYFTSDKSQIVEVATWLAENTNFKNPFMGAFKVENPTSSYNISYLDIMIFKYKQN